MNSLFNRLLLMFMYTTLLLLVSYKTVFILYINIAIAFSALEEYFNSIKIKLGLALSYTALCFMFPILTYFLPLMYYDLITTKFKYLILVTPIVIAFNYAIFDTKTVLFIAIITGIEIILKLFDDKYKKEKINYINKNDTLKEMNIDLKEKLKQSSALQDKEVNLVMLNERNRIAREIHDNVGHLLSSSIIQIGAIMAISKEEVVKNNLQNIQNTLNEGMNSIRKSVHDLHDTSINLKLQLDNIINDFRFCDIKFNYDINTSLNSQIKYATIAIVKEALNNVMKHSNATLVTINLYEHPKIVQLIIIDNGTTGNSIYTNGMGLEGIKERVNSINGIVNIDNKNGFKIFISFKKEDLDEHSNS